MGTTTAAGTHHIFHWPQRTKTEQATTERKLCKCKLDEHKNENENETKKCDAQVGKGGRAAKQEKVEELQGRVAKNK